MPPASNNMLKLARGLFSDASARTAFLDALQNPREYSPALLWTRSAPGSHSISVDKRLDWQPEFVDRLVPGQRPGLDELHTQGFYYCLDMSSVFSASAMLALAAAPSLVLDMCSSPGGKGIFAWRAFKPRLIICNEVIGKRIGALVSNLQRCGIQPVQVSSQDSARFKESAENAFDLVICDVPCSGQSLMARKGEAPGCFHPATINLNSNRQKRIIANSAACVAPGGALHYITCTYSRQENEAVIEWFLKKFPEFRPLAVPALEQNQSRLADFPAYRLWPQEGIGAGGFCCLLKNEGTGSPREADLSKINVRWKCP